jgi:Protein of unknown function (DUF3106)
MSRYTLFRNLPTRIACRVRAGVFVAAVVGLTGAGAMAQGKPRAMQQPKRSFSRPNVQPVPQQRPPQAQQQRPAQAPAQQQTRPMERPSQPATNPAGAGSALVSPGHPRQMQLHLGAWMDAHRSLPLAQQHAALDAEPGFHELNPEEQSRLHQQLTSLNRLPPDKQQQRIQYAEAMEKLSPPQQQQVNKVLGQIGSLPEDRQRAVTRAYRQLRDLPEGQQQAYMNSPQFRSQFNDQERATVGNMVNAAPLLRSFDPPAPGPPKD